MSEPRSGPTVAPGPADRGSDDPRPSQVEPGERRANELEPGERQADQSQAGDIRRDDLRPDGLEAGDRRPAAVRLAAPPAQRYAPAAASDAEPGDRPTPLRGLVLAALVAAFTSAILVVLGGMFDFTVGLIVVAFFVGRFTGMALRTGAGQSMSEARRLGASVVISLVAVLVAQLALWAWALAEGGVLGPIDFLAQTYGVLVLLELLLAGGAAWLAAS